MKKFSVYLTSFLVFLFVFSPVINNNLFSHANIHNKTIYGPLLDETWEEIPPYNMLCPCDPYGGARSLVGIIPLSIAHIINYHKNINSVYFTDSDDYFCDPIYIDDDHAAYDFPSFPELNTYMDSIRYCYANNLTLNIELIAALNFACGVARAHQYFNYDNLPFSEVAGLFLNKFNYQEANYTANINDEFYRTLKNNIISGKPAILTLLGSSGGTAVICDGYDSNNDTYSLRFMWGGLCDGFYSLPDGLPLGFDTIEDAIIDITPSMQCSDDNPGYDFNIINYPNPFHETTTIFFSQNQNFQKDLAIQIYNIKGQLIKQLPLVTESQSSKVSVTWDGTDEFGHRVSSGLYFYQVKSGEKIIAKNKCLLLR
ncbi:MAG: C10 family peptidase [Candidatus Cloacimonetes bacterium]|nr:C10 family peptidase [Candidatus Cloacimonadota bacterium]MBS3767102.1 C10 family peptidase [Candidatus Cloacimonadota bacterium]